MYVTRTMCLIIQSREKINGRENLRFTQTCSAQLQKRFSDFTSALHSFVLVFDVVASLRTFIFIFQNEIGTPKTE